MNQTDGAENDLASDARRPRILRLALLVVPLALTLAGMRLGELRRPYWVGSNSDPEYAYLLSSAALAELKSPVAVGSSSTAVLALHPGTTVHALGALTLRARAVLSGEEMLGQVLRDPEGSLRAINGVLLAAHAGMCLLLGWGALRLSGRVWIAVAAQAAHGVEVGVLVALARVVPEALMVSASLAFGAIVMLGLARGRARPVALGVLTGLGMATKLTFAPVALCALVVLPGVRARARYGLAAAVSFVLAVSPVWGHAPAAYRWVWGLLVNTGPHGMPGDGVVVPGKYPRNLWRLVTLAPVWAVVLCVSAAAVVAIRWKLWPRLDERRRAVWRALLGVVCVEGVQALVAAKYPQVRHMTPVLGLLGVNVALLAMFAGELARGRRVLRGLLIALLVGAGVFSADAVARAARGWRRSAIQGMEMEKQGRDEVERGRTLVHLFCSSSPVAALGFGNEWGGRRFGAELRALHPREFHWYEYDAPDLRKPSPHYTFFGQRVEPGVVESLAAEGKVVFQGPKPFLPAGFEYEQIAITRNVSGYGMEGLFVARPKRVDSPAK